MFYLQTMNITGVVLSGGKSSRMGEDKGLILLKNKPLAQYVIEVLAPSCNNLIISANSSKYKRFGLTCINDKIKGIGPIGGMHAVMQSYPSDYYFFVSCDMPHANTNLVSELIEKSQGYEIVVPQHSGGKIEPLFGLYAASVLQKIEKHIVNKNFKLMDLLKECNTYFYQIQDQVMQQNPNMFKNYNTTSDFE